MLRAEAHLDYRLFIVCPTCSFSSLESSEYVVIFVSEQSLSLHAGDALQEKELFAIVVLSLSSSCELVRAAAYETMALFFELLSGATFFGDAQVCQCLRVVFFLGS
jgi:hypothetical protein